MNSGWLPQEYAIGDCAEPTAGRNSRYDAALGFRCAPPRLMTPLTLHRHPASTAAPGLRIAASVSRRPDGLAFSFRLQADPAQLRLPAAQPAGAADGLWMHTCFEAFVAAAGTPAYREFNFSPSGQWAAYVFRDYRRRDGTAPPMPPPTTTVRRTGDGVALEALVPAAALPPDTAGAGLEIGLAAVIERADGTLSYWALAHPAPRPDFHDRAGFVLHVGPPGRPHVAEWTS